MANQKMRTVVATALHIMYTDDGYTSVSAGGRTTMWKVMDYLKRIPKPTFDENFWPLADEVIEYFQQLPVLPEYKDIMARKDSARFKSCIDIAKDDEVSDVSFPFAVEMGRLYGELCPATPQALNPLKTEAKMAAPGDYMGTLNQADRFFVKLERVGAYNSAMGGYLFQVKDRNGNHGYFYGKADKYENEMQLNDCFSMHATPYSQQPDTETGKKLTGFRMVTIIENKGSGSAAKDPAKDATRGKFSK